jgi:hypothetical protein
MNPSAKVLHALTSLMLELERCATVEAMRKAVSDPGTVADHYRAVKGTEGGPAVLQWLAEQLRGHINARAIEAGQQQPNGSKPDANDTGAAATNP